MIVLGHMLFFLKTLCFPTLEQPEVLSLSWSSGPCCLKHCLMKLKGFVKSSGTNKLDLLIFFAEGKYEELLHCKFFWQNEICLKMYCLAN